MTPNQRCLRCGIAASAAALAVGGLCAAAVGAGGRGGAVPPWPAEAWGSAINLTQVEGPGTNDFYEDLSGAFWNPQTRVLWVVRNGPTDSTSKLWALKETGLTGMVVDTRSGNRGEWTNFGDLEAVTQANLNEDVVYLMIEGEERIKAYGVSVYGTATLLNNWNTSPYLPVNGSLGAEGLAFVPDAYLRAAGFVDPAGQPRTSQRGMGGLMFVGHQNGGRVYVFDLDRSNSTFAYVGAYKTNFTETAELFFDRSTGLLFILHGDTANTVQVSTLASTMVGGERVLDDLVTYSPPPGAPAGVNLEGFAVQGAGDCGAAGVAGGRSVFFTNDDGGAQALMRFRLFPCGRLPCAGDWNGDGAATPADLAGFVNSWLAGVREGVPIADVDRDGANSPSDIAAFVNAWLAAVGGGGGGC